MLVFLFFFCCQKNQCMAKNWPLKWPIEREKKNCPGTIYPALKSLREMGFISEEREGKTIVYSLTASGDNALKIAKRKFVKTFFGVFQE
jgi:PadR family transcriptional regulator